jgi:hypothetical protein
MKKKKKKKTIYIFVKINVNLFKLRYEVNENKELVKKKISFSFFTLFGINFFKAMAVVDKKCFVFCTKLIPPKEYKLLMENGTASDPSQGLVQYVISVLDTDALKRDRSTEVCFKSPVPIDSAVFMKNTDYEVNVPFMMYDCGFICEFHLSCYILFYSEIENIDEILKTRVPVWFKILPMQLEESFFPPNTVPNKNYVHTFENKVHIVNAKYKTNRMLSIMKTEKCGTRDDSFPTKEITFLFSSKMNNNDITKSKVLQLAKLFAEEDAAKVKDNVMADSYLCVKIDRVFFSDKGKKTPLTRFTDRTYYLSYISVCLCKNGFPDVLLKEINA